MGVPNVRGNKMRKKVDGVVLKTLIENINEIFTLYEGDKYKTKQHLIDRVDKILSAFKEEYLN